MHSAARLGIEAKTFRLQVTPCTDSATTPPVVCHYGAETKITV